ncbi:MAG: hypothetical protein HQL96_15975 [Magnetococcales bacterium]|nr:hypothetical protein [Magnetococcales bacterium]
MKRLGEVVLPDGLTWLDRYMAAPVEQTVVRTLGGRPVLRASQRREGLPVTLAAQEEGAFFDLATVVALAGMAGQAGASFTLEWEEWSGVVLFRHEDPPALSVTPLWPGCDRFTGIVKLVRY